MAYWRKLDDETFEAVARIYHVPAVLILKLEPGIDSALQIIPLIPNEFDEQSLIDDLGKAIFIQLLVQPFQSDDSRTLVLR